jgi:hypothetical protein
LALLAAVSLLSACASPDRTGATFTALQSRVGQPKPGQGRIVVLRTKAFSGIIDVGWEVRLDNEPMGDLKTGTFVYRDRPAGTHELTFARAGDLYRASRRTVTVVPGRTYYFRLEMNDKGNAVQASATVAGLAGLLIVSAATSAQDDRGLFDFVPVEGRFAQEAMAEVRLAE